jgi:enamine deaminase RidA (YjgF/YER057c/UK114 family)
MGGRSRGIALAGVGVVIAGILLTVALQGERSVPHLGGRRRVIRAGPNTAGLPYSPGILVGNTLYLAGTIGEDAANNIVPGGIQAETRQALANVGEVLKAAVSFRVGAMPRRPPNPQMQPTGRTVPSSARALIAGGRSAERRLVRARAR